MRNKSVLGLIGFVVLVSFQNCGFSGFVINEESNVPGVTDLSNNNGNTNLTTIPKGQLTQFKIPDQVGSLEISVIGYSQNKVFGFSSLLNQFVEFNSDGNGHEIVKIQEPAMVRITGARSSLIYSRPGYIRYLNINPATVVNYQDSQDKIQHGVLMTASRKWTRLELPKDCAPQIREAANVGEFLVYCTINPYTENERTYFQRLDRDGELIGSVVQINEKFELGNARPLSGETLVNYEWKKMLNISNGVVSNLRPEFEILSAASHYLYRMDRQSIIYVNHDYMSLREKSLATGQDQILLSSSSSFNINGGGESILFAYDQSTRKKYIVSGTGSNTVTPLSDAVLGYAFSKNHLALFTPDPSSTSIKIDVKLYDSKTLSAVNLCSSTAPSSTDFYGYIIGYPNFNPYFANSIGSDVGSYGHNIAFAMDRNCSDLFLATSSSSSGNTLYNRSLYKYSVRTMQTQVLLTKSGQSDGYGYFGDLMAIDKGALYFTLPSRDEVYVSNSSGNLASMVLGKVIKQNNSEPRISEWHYNITGITTNSGQNRFLFPLEDTSIVNLALPKIRTAPMAQFITNGGRNYVLVTRETDSDTAVTDAYSVQFYDENNKMLKKENFNFAGKDSRYVVMPQIDYLNKGGPFVGLDISSYSGDKVNHTFVVANMQKQSLTIVAPPSSVAFSYDNRLTPEGNVFSTKAFCKVSSAQCSSDPFGIDEAKSDIYINQYAEGAYFLHFINGGVNSIRRYNYNENSGFTLLSKIDQYAGQISADNQWLFNNDYDTKKISVYNLSSGVKSVIDGSYDSVWSVRSGLMAFSRDVNDVYTYWNIELPSLKVERVTDLSGSKSLAYMMLDGQSVDKNSDLLFFSSSQEVILLSASTKKVLKRIAMPAGSQKIWANSQQLILGQTADYAHLSQPDYKYKMILIDLNTLAEKVIDTSKYSSFICSTSFANDDTFCIGARSGSRYLVKFSAITLSFEEIAELNGERNFGGFVFLSKDLALIKFSSVRYMDRYVMVNSQPTLQLGYGWEGYVYKK